MTRELTPKELHRNTEIMSYLYSIQKSIALIKDNLHKTNYIIEKELIRIHHLIKEINGLL